MSELVENVEDAIEYQIQNHGYGPHVSRAAIAAVLEWYSDPKNITFKMIEEFAYFDGDDDYDVSRAIAAAMDAELRRAQK